MPVCCGKGCLNGSLATNSTWRLTTIYPHFLSRTPFFFSLSFPPPSSLRVCVRGRDAAPRCCTETERNGMDSCFQCAVKRENFGTCKFLVHLRLGGAGSRERDKRDVAAVWHVFNSGAERRRFPGRADLSSQPVPNFIEHLGFFFFPLPFPEITSSSRCHTLSTRLPMHWLLMLIDACTVCRVHNKL